MNLKSYERIILEDKKNKSPHNNHSNQNLFSYETTYTDLSEKGYFNLVEKRIKLNNQKSEYVIEPGCPSLDIKDYGWIKLKQPLSKVITYAGEDPKNNWISTFSGECLSTLFFYKVDRLSKFYDSLDPRKDPSLQDPLIYFFDDWLEPDVHLGFLEGCFSFDGYNDFSYDEEYYPIREEYPVSIQVPVPREDIKFTF